MSAAIPSERLADPAQWPRPETAPRRLAGLAAVTGGLGLASALLAGWLLGVWATAAVYGALTLSAAAVGYAVALGRTGRAGGDADLTLVRAALGAGGEALAITDPDGRLVCANAAYGARCGGYLSPFDLDPDAMAALAAQARRDGAAEAMAGPEGERLAISVRPADTRGGHLLWTVGDPAIAPQGDTARLIDGGLGDGLGAAGLFAALTDRDGRLLAANRRLREAAGDAANFSDIYAAGEGVLRLADGTNAPVRRIDTPPAGDGTHLFLLASAGAGGSAGRADLRALLEMLPLGLAVADRDGRLGYMNAAFAASAGAGDLAKSLHPTDLVVDEDKTLVSDAVRRAANRDAKPRELRVRLIARSDETSVLTLAQVPDPENPGVILSLRDNREQQKLERQVAQATKMQAVGQLAGGVAHDFNNILTAVIGYCDLMMLRHAPGDADFDDINQIRQNANRAANLVRQLLAFSRQQTLRLQLLQIPDVIGELSHLLKRLLGETIVLTVRHGRNLGAVRADPGQLEQVIVNLAVNARDAMQGGGELTISTYAVSAAEVAKLGYDMMPAADFVVIAVRDTGTGIDPGIVGKIFEPFFTTKEFGKGTGLGLSTVYGIVKQTGGFIFADPAPGGGTIFTLYLPVQHAGAAVAAEAAAAPAAAAAEAWGSGTILLVEDEGTVRAVAERALSRKGYDVLAAAHGEEALEILDRRPEGVDLLITDVVMPTMDGPTLVAEARRRFPDLRIIFMSGYAEEQLRRSIDVPGVAFLPKPFSVKELGETVRAMLARETA